jgi:2'-5' RNA ligase superfamily
MPHVTLLQSFVRAKDFDTVTAAITKVFAAEEPTKMKLTTKRLDYVMFAGVVVTILVVERTPELVRLHHKIYRRGCAGFSERRDHSDFRRRSGRCGNG